MEGALQAVEGAVQAGVAAGGGAALPGMIFNSKKTVTWTDCLTGKEHTEPAGRMECTMQVGSKSFSQGSSLCFKYFSNVSAAMVWQQGKSLAAGDVPCVADQRRAQE